MNYKLRWTKSNEPSGQDGASVHKHAKKNLANIQPSWPHAWSITLMYGHFAGPKKLAVIMSWPYYQGGLKPRLHERFFARAGDAIFSNFVASPARHENHTCSHPWIGDATGKKIARKSRQSWNFCDKIAEIVARVATLQLFARACDATKDYLANEIQVGISVYSAQVSWSMRFARPSICRPSLSQV